MWYEREYLLFTFLRILLVMWNQHYSMCFVLGYKKITMCYRTLAA